MEYTFVFGAPVRTADKEFGRLERIIVNNGIANQLSVDPGLFGYERVIPINVITQATADGIDVSFSEDEWKSFPSFKTQRSVSNPAEDAPNLTALTPEIVAWSAPADTDHPTTETGARQEDRSVDQMSVVVSKRTSVVNETRNDETHGLRGMIVDIGRLQQLLLDNDTAVDADAVTILDEERIHIGGQHQEPLLDADRGYVNTTAQDPKGDERR